MQHTLAVLLGLLGTSYGNPLYKSSDAPRDIHLRSTSSPALDSSGIRPRDVSSQIEGTQQIALAAYIYPGNEDVWKRLAGYPSDKLSVLTVNVLNGPDSIYNEPWNTVITNAANSGKTVLGYVRTGYLGLGTPPAHGLWDYRTRLKSLKVADWIAQIEADVDMWYKLYGNKIGGIFFDEGWNLCGTSDNSTNEIADVYAYIDRYVKLRYPGAFTVLNPGVAVPKCYQHTMDTLLTFEGPFNAPEADRPPDYLNDFVDIDWEPEDIRKIWHIVYDVNATSIDTVAKLALDRHAGLLHLTNDTDKFDSNPYDVLPDDAYMKKQLAAVEGGSPLRETKSFPSGSPAETPGSFDVASFDYTSAKLKWSAALNALGYQIYYGNTVNISVPADVTEVTVGGLSPDTTYEVSVTAIGGDGKESEHSNSKSITTLQLPNGQPIGNYSSTPSDTSTVVRASVVVPYSAVRAYFWDTVNCDVTNLESAYPVYKDSTQTVWACGRYKIESKKLSKFIGKPPYANNAVPWAWEDVGDVKVTEDGYTYTWEVPIGLSTFDTSKIAVQVEGYGPRTAVFEPPI